MKNSKTRKEESIELLKKQGVPYLESLPEIEDATNVSLRTNMEIFYRIYTLFMLFNGVNGIRGNAVSKEEVANDIKEMENKNEIKLTEKEKEIVNNLFPDQDMTNLFWRCESLWVLLWSVGLVEKLEFPKQLNIGKLYEVTVKFIKSEENILDAANKLVVRDIEEILDETDLIYRYDWACVDARVNNKETPAGLDSGVVYERHYALNWLVKAYDIDAWDDVETHT